jgi:DNA (cytosine-5)-methyltransferase 1
VSYYGNGKPYGIDAPLPTITVRDRFGLVTVAGIEDIRLRMLKPEELKLAQGFPSKYIIDRYWDGTAVPKGEQTAKIGNSVVPIMARKLVEANVA